MTKDEQILKWLEKPSPRCSYKGCLSDDLFDRYSFGCYAGRWCDTHWPMSGYRDATDPDAVFDPMYAGERIEDDY
jgi:hypothetical protein